jgi:hypothetical protein
MIEFLLTQVEEIVDHYLEKLDPQKGGSRP